MLLPVGYQWLVENFALRVLPHHRRTYVGGRRSAPPPPAPEGVETHVLPRSHARPDELGPQLEFAIRYEGVNLEVLRATFAVTGPEPVADFVRSKPTGKHARRLWYLYELLTGRELDLPDLGRVAFVDVLDTTTYYTASPRPSARHRVRDNLLGNASFCPMVRRTAALRAWEDQRLDEKAAELIRRQKPDILRRAVSFLYTKETRSSFEIEHEQVGEDRARRFVRLLQQAPKVAALTKPLLLELQASVVDPRFSEGDYRHAQNYVGETLGLHRERVHFVAPKPQDVADMMSGLLDCAQRLETAEASAHAVVRAAAVSFGFVFIHPFEDGNGRVHRFLIHQVLSRSGFAPTDVIFPVSAAMLADPTGYDRCLERFSRPLLDVVDFRLDDRGALTVQGETAHHYRYFDATTMAEQLFGWIDRTIEVDLKDELDFVAAFQRARDATRGIVDLPDKLLDLFVSLCWQNRGRLAERKRKRFSRLSGEEIEAMETAVRREMGTAAADGQGPGTDETDLPHPMGSRRAT